MSITRTQIVITKAGTPDVFELQQSKLAKPKPNEVTLKVKAAGVNFADILARQGLYQDAPPLPCTVGYEVAGEVVDQGEFVTKLHDDLRGKRYFGLTHFGGYANYVNIPIDQLFATPNTLNDVQAASIPVTYLTAYQLTTVMGGLKPNETVLIHNAGGGVGLAILDIAKHIGATTIGTASAQKHEFLAERGLDHAIDYRTEDWQARVLDITQGFGVSLALDSMGGESFSQSLSVLRSTGRLGMFGVSTASDSSIKGKLKLAKTAAAMPFVKIHPINLMMQNKGVFGVNIGHMWDEVAMLREWTGEIMAGIHAGWVRPHVCETFAFSEAAAAHRFIESRQSIGKVVLVPDTTHSE